MKDTLGGLAFLLILIGGGASSLLLSAVMVLSGVAVLFYLYRDEIELLH